LLHAVRQSGVAQDRWHCNQPVQSGERAHARAEAQVSLLASKQASQSTTLAGDDTMPPMPPQVSPHSV
jgi:hypothetical protein